jgi:hypothetical protein
VIATAAKMMKVAPLGHASQIQAMFAAGEIMAGNVLARGYAAGIGMTIGSVFGRAAGQGAAHVWH